METGCVTCVTLREGDILCFAGAFDTVIGCFWLLAAD